MFGKNNSTQILVREPLQINRQSQWKINLGNQRKGLKMKK